MISFPNINTVSTIVNGTLYGLVPNFFCNNVPSLVLSNVVSDNLYIMPISSGLPQVIDATNLPQGTVSITSDQNGGVGPYTHFVATNFKQNGCDSILIAGVYSELPISYIINGAANFPSSFSVTEMWNDNQYGFVFQGGVHIVAGGYFSSTIAQDIALCFAPNSWTQQSCAIVYSTPDQFPPQINQTWLSSNNEAGFNVVADSVDLEFYFSSGSSFAKQGGFFASMNFVVDNYKTISTNFTIINPVQKGALSGNVLLSSILGKYATDAVFTEDPNYNDDYRESPNTFNYASGDFNNNGALDLFVVFVPEGGGDFCLVGYMLYDLKGQTSDIDINTQGTPIYNYAAGTCQPLSRYDMVATRASAADVNGDGITDLLLTNIGIGMSIGSYIAYGSSSGIATVMTQMTPAQGLNLNITALTLSYVGGNLLALGDIDSSGKAAFMMTDENGVAHIMQLAGSAVDAVDAI